jgi:hypothetical protein
MDSDSGVTVTATVTVGTQLAGPGCKAAAGASAREPRPPAAELRRPLKTLDPGPPGSLRAGPRQPPLPPSRWLGGGTGNAGPGPGSLAVTPSLRLSLGASLRLRRPGRRGPGPPDAGGAGPTGTRRSGRRIAASAPAGPGPGTGKPSTPGRGPAGPLAAAARRAGEFQIQCHWQCRAATRESCTDWARLLTRKTTPID